MKKRLLGALVLIVLAIIFVPMLLPGHSDAGSQSVSLKIPQAPDAALQTRILKVGPDSASAGSSTQAAIDDPDHVAMLNLENRPAAQASPGTSAPSIEATTRPAASLSTTAPAASAVAPSAAKAERTPEVARTPPAASAKAAPVTGGAGVAAGTLYTVNLGIYADRASADKLVAQAKQHGFAAIAMPETYQGKPVQRVTAGPFHSRAEAEAARLKLKDVEHVSMTIEANAVNQRGDAPASALAASQPGAWAVQLAAFGSESAANQLRDSLRGQGLDGYVDSVSTAKGKLWRVRAGPFASREAAETAQGQIARKLKIKGNIVTQD